MRKFLCTVMATFVAVTAMAVGMPRNTQAPLYKAKTSQTGKLLRKPGTAMGKLLPQIDFEQLNNAKRLPALKATSPDLWAAFTIGYEEITDPGIYSFQVANQFTLGKKIFTNSKAQGSSPFTNATASVVGDGKLFVSSWYGFAKIFDMTTGEQLFSTGTDAISNIFYSACYDEESKLVYGAFFNNDATALQWASFDMNTQVKTVIADVSNYGIIGCDFDASGNVWFIAADGTIYKTDKMFRNVTTLGNIGATPACEYSNGGMCIDKDANTIYWAFDIIQEAEDGEEYLYPYMVSINLNTYAVQTYQSNFIVAGMYMPINLTEDKTVPAAPATVTLTRDGDNAVITWDAVTTNEAGDAITGVTYNVIDKTNNNAVATGVTGTTYTVQDVKPEGIKTYYYAVVAVADGKTSKATESNKVAFGDAYALPHTFPIEENVDVDQFTIIDANNDGTTWFFENRGNFNVFTITENATNPKDDWLITPPVKVKASNSVRMQFVARVAALNFPEDMEIKAGKGNTVEAMTVEVQKSTVYKNTSYAVYDVSFTVPEDGNYCIGFHAVSPADQYELYIDDIVLEEGAALDGPKKVENLKLTPAPMGAHECEVECVAPKTTVNGGELNNFKVNVFRGTQLVQTFDNVEAGEELGFTDEDVPNGFNTYNVVAVSAQGVPSDTVKAEAYVGYGTPRVAEGCKLRVIDGNLVAMWNTPKTDGINGYVDPSRVSHNIYMLDEYEGELVKLLTSEPGSLSAVLQRNVGLYDQAMISVYVEAVDVENKLVSGKRVETNKCLYGKPYDLPYVDDLETSPYEWFVIENAVGTSTDGWQYGVQDGAGVLYVKCDYPTGEAVVNTGMIALNGAQHATLVFDQYLGDMAYNDELQVQVGKNNVEEFTTVATLTRNATPESPWITRVIDLSAFADAEWISIQFHAQGAPQGQSKRYYQMLRNIRLMDAVDNDLALEVLEVSNNGELRHNSSNTIKVKVTNYSATKVAADAYSVVLNKATGETANAAEVTDLDPLTSKTFNLVYTCAGPDEQDEITLTAQVNHAGDPNLQNNSENVTLKLVRPTLPTVENLEATEADTKVLLTWSIPETEVEAVDEDFEGYSAFSVGDEVLADKGYTIYFDPQPTEKCGSGSYDHAGEAIGWLVFDNKKAGFGASGAYAPHSGNQCLVAFDGSKKMDTWLITPELSGNEQTISFWTGALTGNWGNEEFNVLYSTTGNDKGDFIKINDEVLTERDSQNWTKREFKVPAGAKYFAIQVVSTDKMGFKLDDLKFEAGKSLSVDITGYEITVDGILTKTVDGKLNTMVKEDGSKVLGTYMEMPLYNTTYGVSIVTPWGVGEEKTVLFEPTFTGINELTIDAVNNGNNSIFDLLGRKLNRVNDGGVYIINGKKAVVK